MRGAGEEGEEQEWGDEDLFTYVAGIGRMERYTMPAHLEGLLEGLKNVFNGKFDLNVGVD